MGQANLSTLDGIAKDDYLDVIVEMTNNRTWVLDKVKREAAAVTGQGRRTVFSVESRPNRSFQAGTDGGTLAQTDSAQYDDGILTLSYFNGGMEMTQIAMAVMKGSGVQGSMDAFKLQMRSLQQQLKNHICRVIYSDNSGALTVCGTTTASLTVTVSTTQYIEVGMLVDIAATATGTPVTNGTARTVISVNHAAGTFVIDTGGGTVTTSSSHAVYMSESYGNEFDGLRFIASTSREIYGIDSATPGNEYFNGKIRDVGASAAAPEVAGPRPFQQLANSIGKTGQAEVGVFVTTRGVQDRLALTYESQKRFEATRPVELHGGYEAIYVNKIPVIYDDDCPLGFAFALPKNINETFTWKQTGDPDWLKSEDGQIFNLKNSTTAGRKVGAWQAWIEWNAALGCISPQRVGQLRYMQDDDPE